MLDNLQNPESFRVHIENSYVWVQFLTAFAGIGLLGATAYLAWATNKMARAAKAALDSSEKLNEINTRALGLQRDNIELNYLSWVLGHAPILDFGPRITFSISSDGSQFYPSFDIRNNGSTRACLMEIWLDDKKFDAGGRTILAGATEQPSTWRSLPKGSGQRHYFNVKPPFTMTNIINMKMVYSDPFGNKYFSECSAKKLPTTEGEANFKIRLGDFKFRAAKPVELKSIFQDDDRHVSE